MMQASWILWKMLVATAIAQMPSCTTLDGTVVNEGAVSVRPIYGRHIQNPSRGGYLIKQISQDRIGMLRGLPFLLVLSLGLSASPAVAGTLLIGNSGDFEGSPPRHIDQAQSTINQTIGANAVGGMYQQKLAQTITVGRTGLLTQVDLPAACNPQADLIISIEDVTDGTPNGTVRFTQSFTHHASGPVLRSFELSKPVPIKAGEQIAIIITAADSASCAMWQGPVGDSYPAGNGFFDARPNAPGWVCKCRFSGRPFDFPFQTWVRGPGKPPRSGD